jgi:hypothetical protein
MEHFVAARAGAVRDVWNESHVPGELLACLDLRDGERDRACFPGAAVLRRLMEEHGGVVSDVAASLGTTRQQASRWLGRAGITPGRQRRQCREATLLTPLRARRRPRPRPGPGMP